MMAVNLGDKPLADFTQPIEMLKDCHRRIEHFLDVLRKVDEKFGNDELNEEGRRALEKSLNYFAHSAPRHTADEEQSLFPRMRSSDSDSARAVIAELDQLECDHRRGEACHARIDQIGRKWLEAGRIGKTDRESFQTALGELQSLYAAHIPLEEQRVFVVASQMLEKEQVRDIGEEMKQRRSLSGPGHVIADALTERKL